jgi:large repetitive protein
VTKFYMHSFISLGSSAVPTVRLDAASDTGRSATDGITSDSTPSFSGTAPAGSTVSVRDGSAVLGSATAGSSGAWSFQSPALAQGEHTISAVAGSASSTVLGVTIDTTAPPPPAITSPADGATVSGPTVAVAGTTGAGQNVAVRDGSSAIASSTATSTGAWSANVTLAAGGHTLTATTADPAGNVSSASAAVRVTVGGASSGAVFSDGFESGGFSAWSAATTGGDGTATVQQSIVRAGQFAARLTETGNAGSFAKVSRSLGGSYKDLTVSLDIRIDAEGASGLVVPIIRVYDGAGSRLLSLYRRNANFNGVGVSNAGATYNTSGNLPLGTWRRYSVRLIAAGAGASTVIVTQDGAQIFTTTTASLGTGVASIQLGNENAAQAFTLEADGVQVTTG